MDDKAAFFFFYKLILLTITQLNLADFHLAGTFSVIRGCQKLMSPRKQSFEFPQVVQGHRN